MLIVVAIIAILIAVSIPMVSSALERARVATDAANERACKAEAIICFLNGKLKETDTTNTFTPGTGTYCYDAQNGQLVTDASTVVKYGKCTKTHGTDVGPHKDKPYLWVSVSVDGEVFMTWATSTNPGSTTGLKTNSGLHGINVDAS